MNWRIACKKRFALNLLPVTILFGLSATLLCAAEPKQAKEKACPAAASCGLLRSAPGPVLGEKATLIDNGLRQAFGVAALAGPSAAVSVSDRRTTADRPTTCDPPPKLKTSFAPTDAQIYQWTTISGANLGDVVRWDWIKPDGTVYVSHQLVLTLSGSVCFWDSIFIANQPPSGIPGTWQVQVVYNGSPLFTDAFTIGGASTSGRLCSPNLQVFWGGAVTLGYATVRASCSLGQILPDAVVTLMTSDLSNTAVGVNALSPCLRFDTTRITGLAAQLPGMLADQALQQLQQLTVDLQQAVRQAGMTPDRGLGPSTTESFFLDGIFTGYGEARSTCFTCQYPLPSDVVFLIGADLANARQNLQNYAACVSTFDFNLFGNVRLGDPFLMINSYSDLVAVHTATQLAIANSDCCWSCGGGPAPTTSTGAVKGTIRNASNGQPISGATISVTNTTLKAASASDGTYTLSNVPVGSQTLAVSASGFISTQIAVNVVAGQTATLNVSLSPTLQSGEIRITLNWTKDSSNRPDDLDMHLTGPNPDGTSCFEVYYGSTGNLAGAPYAKLEVDNILVAGHPPTETIRISRSAPGLYRFFVNNYSSETPDGISRSGATVQVFNNSGLLFSRTAPAGSGLYWTVFTLNGQTGAINEVNQFSGSPPPASPCR